MTAQPKPTPKRGRASAQPDSTARSRGGGARARRRGRGAAGLGGEPGSNRSQGAGPARRRQGPDRRHRHGQERPCRAARSRPRWPPPGSPAMYVHPAEASHGDLGMIVESDAVLALSNSGDTPELADIIAYTRRFRIPLVAITGGKSSALARRRRCGADPAVSRRGLPHGPGADDVDHHDIGAGRCASRWRCWSAAASRRRISACCIPAASSAAA